MTSRSTVSEVDWLLNDLMEQVAGAEHVVLLSADGLLLGRSKNLSRADADHLSAVASGFQSLARGTGWHFSGGEVRQTVVEMEHLFVMVTAAGNGACLAVLATADADLGMIAYEVNRMVARVGPYLGSTPRSDAATAVDTRVS